MAKNKTFVIFFLLAALATAAYAQGANSGTPLRVIEWRIGDVTRILLCSLWFITAGILGLVALLSGIKYLTNDSPDDRDKAKKMAIYGVFGVIIVGIACPTVNYLVNGSDVRQFRCDCLREVPPTSTTSTTSSTWVFNTVTTVTSTTTTTISSTTTTWPKSQGGRFLLVGEDTFNYVVYTVGDLYGVIFNMDGTVHKDAFKIDSGILDPVALGVGNNRFFVAYGESAVVLDWEGQTIKAKFTTEASEFPVKVIQTNDKFYLLLSHKDTGGCEIKVYNIDGNLMNTFKIDIDSISYMTGNPMLSSSMFFPEGDMSLEANNFFIVWADKKTSTIYGMVYDLNGNKVKDKFSITSIVSTTPDPFSIISPYENPEVETGSKYVLVAYDDKIFLYDFNANLVSQKASGLQHVHDLTYGDGKFLAVENSDGKFYDEDGNSAGTGTFGGHGDVPTTLSYGNHMFVGIVAIHMAGGDGIGASFMDSSGVHKIDTMPLEMAESPGWSAYDW